MTLGRLRLSVADARDLAEGALRSIGYHNDEARIIADHVIDAAMCGYEYSGLARILNVDVHEVHTNGRVAHARNRGGSDTSTSGPPDLWKRIALGMSRLLSDHERSSMIDCSQNLK
jgi:hypothetical protein